MLNSEKYIKVSKEGGHYWILESKGLPKKGDICFFWNRNVGPYHLNIRVQTRPVHQLHFHAVFLFSEVEAVTKVSLLLLWLLIYITFMFLKLTNGVTSACVCRT